MNELIERCVVGLIILRIIQGMLHPNIPIEAQDTSSMLSTTFTMPPSPYIVRERPLAHRLGGWAARNDPCCIARTKVATKVVGVARSRIYPRRLRREWHSPVLTMWSRASDRKWPDPAFKSSSDGMMNVTPRRNLRQKWVVLHSEKARELRAGSRTHNVKREYVARWFSRGLVVDDLVDRCVVGLRTLQTVRGMPPPTLKTTRPNIPLLRAASELTFFAPENAMSSDSPALWAIGHSGMTD